jgi:hypothetical protein
VKKWERINPSENCGREMEKKLGINILSYQKTGFEYFFCSFFVDPASLFLTTKIIAHISSHLSYKIQTNSDAFTSSQRIMEYCGA